MLRNVDDNGFAFDGAPRTLGFHSVVVAVHLDPEVPRFSPVGSPAVPANPVLHTSAHSPAQNRDFVVQGRRQVGFSKDPSFVGVELSCGLQGTSDWPSLVNFGLHLICARH